MPSHRYDQFGLPIPYSGGMVVGRDFLREFYVHMGFHRPHCFATVHELVLDEGRVIPTVDHSAAMERVRSRIQEHREDGRSTPSHEEIARFVDEAFSLTYATKWQ